MWKSLSISKKIWIGISILIIGYFLSMLTGYTGGTRNEKRLSDVSAGIFPATQLSQSCVSIYEEQSKLYQDAVMMGDTDILDTASEKAGHIQKLLHDIGILQALDAESRNNVQDLTKTMEQFARSAHQIYGSMAQEINVSKSESESLAAKALDLGDSLKRLNQHFAAKLKEELVTVNQDIRSQLRINIISFFIIVLGSTALIWFILKTSIVQPLQRTVAVLNKGTEELTRAADSVSSSSVELSERTSDQAASIEETSSSLEEMSSMTKKNAENAGQADNLMKETNQIVEQANNSMDELTVSMREISKAGEETSKIIKTIDEIAFQTNLLALNAAVEAARAGEAGAGFAVVADEVRNLAMRAAEAARNTAKLIEGTVRKVGDGSDLVDKTNDAFDQVAESSKKVGELVGEIASASNEQAEGILQVNKAIFEIDRGVQQNSATAEESASSSEVMNAQTHAIKASVLELISLVAGTEKGADAYMAGTKQSPLRKLPGRIREAKYEK